MSPPLFVGQAPSRTVVDGRPLTGLSGKRLARLSGLQHDVFLRRVTAFNLNVRYRGRDPRGADIFDVEEAEVRKLVFRQLLRRSKTVVLLGRRVEKSIFGSTEHPYLRKIVARGRAFYVFPHPSGLNRYWNDPANVARARRFLRRLLGTPARHS